MALAEDRCNGSAEKSDVAVEVLRRLRAAKLFRDRFFSNPGPVLAHDPRVKDACRAFFEDIDFVLENGRDLPLDPSEGFRQATAEEAANAIDQAVRNFARQQYERFRSSEIEKGNKRGANAQALDRLLASGQHSRGPYVNTGGTRKHGSHKGPK